MCRFDLTLEMTHDSAKDELAGHIEYRTDLFKRSTIEALVNHFAVSETHVSRRVNVSVRFVAWALDAPPMGAHWCPVEAGQILVHQPLRYEFRTAAKVPA